MNSIHKRVFAIGDIHGCNLTFKELLFSKIRITRDDAVYLLGDLCDRGPDSKGVLDTIMGLKADNYCINCLLGNHEDMLIQALYTEDDDCLSEWVECGGLETLDSFKVNMPQEIPEKYIEFIEAMPLYYAIDNYVLVHGGLNFHLKNPLSKVGRSSMLWERDVVVEPQKIGGRKLVVGHTIMDIDEIHESLQSNLITLDNGVFLGKRFEGKGNLVALELNSGELLIQENVEVNLNWR